jgi:hypothetical protein
MNVEEIVVWLWYHSDQMNWEVRLICIETISASNSTESIGNERQSSHLVWLVRGGALSK